VLYLACKKKEGEGDSYMGILHMFRCWGKVVWGYCTDCSIAHFFTLSRSAHFSVVVLCHQSDCGREEAVQEASPVGDDAVRSAVSQVVCAVFVSEQRGSWMK